MNLFNNIAHTQRHDSYISKNIFTHTADEESSYYAPRRYIKFLHKIKKKIIISIGCRVDYTTNTFHKHGNLKKYLSRMLSLLKTP